MKNLIAQLPFLVGAATQIFWHAKGRHKELRPFADSASYWERRYSNGGHSGAGSYGLFAEFKADVLNRFVATHSVQSVIEFGCGDGNQLALVRYPRYLGFDVSETAIAHCRKRFGRDRQKSFLGMRDYAGETAELSLSLDVIYHLVEDDVFARYLRTLFSAALRHVIIYSSDFEGDPRADEKHVRHRQFTTWVQQQLPGWKLCEQLPNRYPYHGDFHTGSLAEFFIYERA